MSRTELLGLVVLAAACAGVGWFVGRQSQPIPSAAVVLTAAPAARPPMAGTDAVSVHADGTASTTVRRAPLPWLLVLDVPRDVLRQLVESDPSDPVRLAAFDAYLDRAAGDVDSLRGILEAARYNPSAAVQADAHRRRDDLERAERMRPEDDPQRQP